VVLLSGVPLARSVSPPMLIFLTALVLILQLFSMLGIVILIVFYVVRLEGVLGKVREDARMEYERIRKRIERTTEGQELDAIAAEFGEAPGTEQDEYEEGQQLAGELRA